ncbi:MAG TPA: ureidoglycolate lyase [Luteolibacter sp.]|nr:ureidoglycolate lyase [Luteolibacter sp.]
MKFLPIEKLTREAFAPFGDVIQLGGAHHYPINLGTTERFHDLANIDVTDEGGRPLVNVFRGQPRELPFEIRMMERHPFGSQAFVPLDDSPYLIVVALPGPLVHENFRAFITEGWQGVNYARNTWHHPLLALGKTSDFIVIDRGGPGNNCIEENLTESLWLKP